MQIHRMLEIVTLLLGGRVLTARALAERFEVSTRTVYRDVEAMSEAGIPVYMTKGRGGGISLTPGYALNKTLLTERERADVLASLKALGGVAPGEADGALKKLGALFGSAGVDWIEVDFCAWGDPKRVSEAFGLLKEAIFSRKIVRFDYSSGKGETVGRMVEPLKLYFRGQAWYLYGFCRDRRDFRLFKLNRMKNLCLTDQAIQNQAPPGEPARYSLPQEELAEVVLKLPAEMAFRVYDEYDAFERLADGSFLVRAQMPKGKAMMQYILSFGECCEVLEPKDTRDALVSRLRKMLARYKT